MRSQCIDSTSGRKSVTGNGFSDINFRPKTWKVSSFDAAFRLIIANFSVRMRSFDHITSSGLKKTSYLNSAHRFGYKDAVTS